MTRTIDLAPEDKMLLDVYKNIESGKPVSLDFGLMEKLQSLKTEMQEAEEQEKPVIEEIETVESVIREKYLELEELRSRLNAKLAYIKETQNSVPVAPKTVNHTIKEEYKDITPDAVYKVISDNPYGAGNVLIAKKLGLEGTIGQQNKIYSIAKKLLAENKIKNENRMWKPL
jgi:chromosome segregation ATPase